MSLTAIGSAVSSTAESACLSTGRNRRGETQYSQLEVEFKGGEGEERGGKRGKADTTETGGGRRMIYALKVALQRICELRRRGIKQDDNALLPREFLGRWCLSIHRVYTGAIPYYSLTVIPPYHVHVSQESTCIHVA